MKFALVLGAIVYVVLYGITLVLGMGLDWLGIVSLVRETAEYRQYLAGSLPFNHELMGTHYLHPIVGLALVPIAGITGRKLESWSQIEDVAD